MTTGLSSPVTLKIWPIIEDDSDTLSTLIARVSAERGSFGDLSEQGLRESIAETEVGGDLDDQNDHGHEDENADGEEREKTLVAARQDIAMQIGYAHESAMYAVDFISLLLSKDLPQAHISVSSALKEVVEMGTLSADKTQVSRITPEQKEANKDVAYGIRYKSVCKAADTILASATGLEKAIESETKYWEQVLAVNKRGWAICRMPQRLHTLGVKYGFSEAAASFRNRSIAALCRNLDGSLHLDDSIVSGEPRYLRVRIERDGILRGESTVPGVIPEDASIESQLLQARNTIFDEELWQELNREARSLNSYGVRASPSTVSFPIPPHGIIVLDLISSDDQRSCPRPADRYAEAACLMLRLLLSQAHRQSHRRRTMPPPPLSATKRSIPSFTLIRPILSRLLYENNLTAIRKLLDPLIVALSTASLSSPPTYSITRSNIPIRTEIAPTIAERTLVTLTDRLESVTTVNLLPGTTIRIASRTSVLGLISTFHFPTITPTDSPLQQQCPPPPTFNSFEILKGYILYAGSCALASLFATEPHADDEDEQETGIEEAGKKGWYKTSQSNVLRKAYRGIGKSKQISFDLRAEPKRGTRLIVRWEWMGNSLYGERGVKIMQEEEGSYEWVSKKSRLENNEFGEVVKTLDDVVEGAGKWKQI